MNTGTTEAENRRLVEKMLGWTVTEDKDPYCGQLLHSPPTFNNCVMANNRLADMTFSTGDQMLLLLEAMAKRGAGPLLAQLIGGEWMCAISRDQKLAFGPTAPAAVRAAALAVIGAT